MKEIQRTHEEISSLKGGDSDFIPDPNKIKKIDLYKFLTRVLNALSLVFLLVAITLYLIFIIQTV